MMSIETIHELRSRTSVTSLEAMHALSASKGNVDQAADFLQTSGFAAKSLAVAGSAIAARLASSLVATGVWFECEQLDREQWRFAVAVAGYARLVALHGELLDSRRTRGAVGDKPESSLEARFARMRSCVIQPTNSDSVIDDVATRA